MAMTVAMMLVCIARFFVPVAVRAAMQSSKYAIPTDSINFGGGDSTSTNFSEEDTLGEVGSGLGTSTKYSLNAGYQQISGSSISLTSAANVTLPAIGGLNSGTTMASSTWNVTTDDAAGYQLSILSATAPALVTPAHAYFGDYAPSGGVGSADFTFAVGSGASTFGFSPEGPDIVSRFKDTGSSCGTGSSDTPMACWAGFTTTSQTIAAGSGYNLPAGASTTVEYEAGIGSNKIQDAGTYTATLTVTAVAL